MSPNPGQNGKGWLTGKAAVVSGGGSGIGEAVVDRFLEEGAMVTVLDRSEPPIAQNESGRKNLYYFQGDVTSYADNMACVEGAIDKFGRLDVFVGNAGIYDGARRLIDLSAEVIGEVFDEVFAINVKGYLLGAKAALPYLVQSKGSMIFTVSNSGFYSGGGGPIYTASKHAVVGLIRELAFELAPLVRVNGVAPAGTITNLKGPSSLGQDKKSLFSEQADWEDKISASKPLAISPKATDHTGAYLFLASTENSRAITGEIIRSDGGLGVRGLNEVSGGIGLDEILDARNKGK